MRTNPVEISVVIVAAALALTVSAACEEPAWLAEQLKDTAPNTVKLLTTEKHGGRMSPAVLWAPGLKRLVHLGGCEGDGKQRHYEIEHFDPATGQWTNAYPKGAPFKEASGVTDAPGLPIPRGGRMKVVDGQGVSRWPTIGNFSGMLHHQYAFDPDAGLLYGQVMNETLIVDISASTVELTEARGFNKGVEMVWGSFCFDPVNKEVVSIGGTSFEPFGTPGTWLFDVNAKKWRKAKVSTPEIDALGAQAEAVRSACWTLLSRCRSRFFITESAEEAKVRLSGEGERLKASLAALAKAVAEGKLPERMKAALEHASARLAAAQASLGGVSGKLDGAMDAELLAELQAAHRLLEAVTRDLSPEPCGRAHAQMAWDPLHKQIVLFGGDGQDRTYADTWLYAPATRTWEQRYPEPSPAPRSCHLLGWLPDARKMVLVGGYDENNKKLPFEQWTYDVGENRWQCLASSGTVWGSKTVPDRFKDLNVTGAVVPGDFVVLLEKSGNYDGVRQVWGLKIDSGKPTTSAAGQGGSAAAVSFGIGPDEFERKAKIEPGNPEAFFKALPANTWISLPTTPCMAPTRDFGTTRYDPIRKQFLWWGGGHVNYFGCEVSHYSVRSGCWTASSTAENYMEPGGQFAIHADVTFRDAPQIPVHAYQCYAFDQPSGLLLVNAHGKTFIYDPVSRRWSWLEDGATSICAIRESAEGAITCGKGPAGTKFMRFDAKQRKWVDLPAPTGDKPPTVGFGYGDYSGFCPDEKRGCLWIFERNGVWRYDLKNGDTKKVAGKISDEQVKGYLRDMIYIPELDRVMFENREKSTRDFHPFWNPEKLTWERAALPVVRDGKPEQPVFSTGQGFMRDPETKLLFVNGGRFGMYAARLDPGALTFEPAPTPAPAKGGDGK
ncbi:MAG: hypothetical protein KIS92_03900 [Planctomycetota bacterium]|nr:hypothetical protein [Planctomycetota bacterium]